MGWRNYFSSCAVVSVFGSGGKLAVFLLWREIFITTGKKKIQSSVWGVRDHYYDRKKKDTVVCLLGDSHLSLVAIVIFVLVQLELNLIQIH